MSDGMRLARDGRINLLERMGSSRPRLEALMQRLVDDGCLRDVDPELLVMQFIGPLLFWRQLHAIGVRTPAIRNRHAFARAHVDSFSVAPPRRPSRRFSRAPRAHCLTETAMAPTRRSSLHLLVRHAIFTGVLTAQATNCRLDIPGRLVDALVRLACCAPDCRLRRRVRRTSRCRRGRCSPGADAWS